MKRKTTKHRRLTRQSVLEVRVMSPRIAWFGFLRFAGKLAKLACVLAVLTGVGYGVWRGIEHAFYNNPDFGLRRIDLNANPVIDELGVTQVAGIDLMASPSLFEINIDEVSRKLSDLPAVVEARAERHLPGTLVVRVTPRLPKAWISSLADGHTETRRVGALLVDEEGIAYPCPELQLETAAKLPVIMLNASEETPIAAGEKLRHPELQHCFRLLEAATEADPDAMQWIESVQSINAWSLQLVTRQGTTATFGLRDHARQMESLRAALDHASSKGYTIATINLIPKYNIPITVRDGQAAPPRAIPVSAPDPATAQEDRRARDISNLLNRN